MGGDMGTGGRRSEDTRTEDTGTGERQEALGWGDTDTGCQRTLGYGGGEYQGTLGRALGDVTGHRDGGTAAALTSHILHIAVSDGSG